MDNVANLPREEVLANFKLEFMECCKYELRDRRLKILYLFMKPIYSSGGAEIQPPGTILYNVVLYLGSQTKSKLYSKV